MAERTKPQAEASALRALLPMIEAHISDIGCLLKAAARLTERDTALDAEDTEMVHCLIGIACGRHSDLCDTLAKEIP